VLSSVNLGDSAEECNTENRYRLILSFLLFSHGSFIPLMFVCFESGTNKLGVINLVVNILLTFEEKLTVC
jgi:hypothetical protein